MTPPALACAPSGRCAASVGFACVAFAVLLMFADIAAGQTKGVWPATIQSLAQTLTTVSGVPTLLTIHGTGNCKFRLSYLKQDGPPALPVQMVFSSTPQSPFPLHLKILDATPPGTYTWTAIGIEGCMGTQSLTFTVR